MFNFDYLHSWTKDANATLTLRSSDYKMIFKPDGSIDYKEGMLLNKEVTYDKAMKILEDNSDTVQLDRQFIIEKLTDSELHIEFIDECELYGYLNTRLILSNSNLELNNRTVYLMADQNPSFNRDEEFTERILEDMDEESTYDVTIASLINDEVTLESRFCKRTYSITHEDIDPIKLISTVFKG